jgi:hypothetical protein
VIIQYVTEIRETFQRHGTTVLHRLQGRITGAALDCWKDDSDEYTHPCRSRP